MRFLNFGQKKFGFGKRTGTFTQKYWDSGLGLEMGKKCQSQVREKTGSNCLSITYQLPYYQHKLDI